MGVYIIAEAGVNHNGSLQTALSLPPPPPPPQKWGADAMKFQTFTAERLIRRNTEGSVPEANNRYGRIPVQSALPARTFPDHEELPERCVERGIDFLSSPFDEESLDFLVDRLGLKTIKFGSGR
ncbi:hypothetical protein MASR2M17_05140 [Aminivibrio sp.]